MSGGYGAPAQPSVGPVRSPRGLVDVEVTAEQVVLRHHDSWRDWFDSDLALGLTALLGVLVFVGGLALGGPLGTVVWVLGVLMVLPLVVVQLVVYGAVAWFALRAVVLVLTPGGRARLRRGAVNAMNAFDAAGQGWRVPRAQVGVRGPVELGRRARLRLTTADGEVVLTTPRRHRERLEALAWALQSR